MRWKQDKLPLARREGLLTQQVADETVVYDEATKEAHCLSPRAAVIFAHCDGRTTIEQLAELATDRTGEPVDVSRVLDALAQLEECELMSVGLGPTGGLSRREMLGRTAAVAGGVAFAAPLVTSVVAPPAVAAVTATCADILCCPCCQQENLNKEECCTTPATVNCQCTGNRDPGPRQAKYCKPSGNSAPSDAFCLANNPGAAFCATKVTGGAGCNTCT